MSSTPLPTIPTINDNDTISRNRDDDTKINNKNISSVHRNATTNRDSCTWYHNDECLEPRTCYDCLNVPLPNDNCTVNPSGVCVSQSTYDSYLAERFYYVPSQRYFPSRDYRYCRANDSVCATCRTQWKQQQDPKDPSKLNTFLPSYCMGRDGCVCIANCEVPDWHDVVVEYQCSDTHDDGEIPFSGGEKRTGLSMPIRVTVSIIAGLTVTLLLVFATWGVRRLSKCRSNEQFVGRRERRLRPGRARLQLSLLGWKSLQQRLIDAEGQSMEDGNAGTPFQTCEGSLAPVKSVYATETRDREESDDCVEMHGELEPCGQMNIDATRER